MAKRPKEGEILPIGDDWERLFPGEFLRGLDIDGRFPTVKIVKLYQKRVRGKLHPVAELEGKERKWRINFTNGLCLKVMFGTDPRKWVGHEVILCTEVVDAFGRGPKPAIRVWGSPELKEEKQVYKDLGGDFGAIRKTMKTAPPGRSGNGGTPSTSRTGGQGGAS